MPDICSIRRVGTGWACERCSASWIGRLEPPSGCLRTDITDEEIVAAALSDPDNPPLTEDDFRRMRRT